MQINAFKTTFSSLTKQGNKALFLYETYPSPSLMCYLFDLLAEPVAEYASEYKIWNYTVSDTNNSLEVHEVHCKFCEFGWGTYFYPKWQCMQWISKNTSINI